MSRAIIYSTTTGEILGTVDSPAVSIMVPAGQAAKDSPVGDIGTHFVGLATMAVTEYSSAGKAAYATPPGAGFVWNPTTQAWSDDRTIAAVRAGLIRRLRTKRDALLYGGLTWDGSTFDSDSEVSQPRLLGAFTTVIAGGWPAEGVAWRLKDNSWRVLSATDVQQLWGAFQTRMMTLFAAFATKEATVNAETDIDVLRNYDAEAGWP